jgi:hypothetical protein
MLQYKERPAAGAFCMPLIRASPADVLSEPPMALAFGGPVMACLVHENKKHA